MAVTVRDADEIALARTAGIGVDRIAFRCAAEPDEIRRAAALGVARFAVSTERHVAVLAGCAQPVKYVHLHLRGPVVLGDHDLRVVGMYCEVSDPDDGWALAVEGLLARTATMRRCGLAVGRVSLVGGSANGWLRGCAPQLSDIVATVDEALDEGCSRWRLPRPAVTLVPLTL
ncbi:hypothetical protein ACQI4F_18075 [Mycolicibacterium vaccae]|uniref:hypothetical protein n=1 Tax=Mycolicibacterium vaccae TaxID=1810 RepID=UPI003CE9D5A6